MPLLPSFRQLGFVLGGVLLATLAGCGKSHHSSSDTASNVVISGKVTYDRIPLLHDANGVPTGLETDPTKFELNLPARYITVSLYRKTMVPDPLFPNDRTKDKVFFGREGSAATADGSFSFSVAPNLDWMLEVQSSIHTGGATSPADVNIVADPAGITSTVPQRNRLRYCIRKAPDGSLPPTASNVNHVVTSNVPAGSPETVVNFHIGVNDSWFLADNDYDLQAGQVITRMVPGYSEGLVVGANPNGYQKAGQLEASPTGSRVLSILDAFVDMAAYLGTSGSLVTVNPGSPLDLHYLKGRTEPRGTYIEWDRSSYPQGQAIDPNTSIPTPTGFSSSFDPPTGAFHYFGSIQGGPSNDDAWDRAQLITLAAKAYLFNQVSLGSYYSQGSALGKFVPLPQGAQLSNLESQMAILEGMPQGIAAVILKNPYIADVTSTGVNKVDIRQISAIPASERNPFCAALYPALTWELALKANSLPRSEDPTDWNKIIPVTLSPFFTPIQPFNHLDTINLYPQLKAMEGSLPGLTTTTPPITDAVIQDVLAHLGVPTGNLPWPRPAVGPLSTFVRSWGSDPIYDPASPGSSSIAPVTLSMANATPVSGVYGNTSIGELAFAQFTISGTKAYAFDVELSNGPLTNGKVEVTFIGLGTPDGVVASTYTFLDSTTTSIPVTFQTVTGAQSTWLVRVRMLSPTAIQPDTTVKIKLVPAA